MLLQMTMRLSKSNRRVRLNPLPLDSLLHPLNPLHLPSRSHPLALECLENLHRLECLENPLALSHP